MHQLCNTATNTYPHYLQKHACSSGIPPVLYTSQPAFKQQTYYRSMTLSSIGIIVISILPVSHEGPSLLFLPLQLRFFLYDLACAGAIINVPQENRHHNFWRHKSSIRLVKSISYMHTYTHTHTHTHTHKSCAKASERHVYFYTLYSKQGEEGDKKWPQGHGQ